MSIVVLRVCHVTRESGAARGGERCAGPGILYEGISRDARGIPGTCYYFILHMLYRLSVRTEITIHIRDCAGVCNSTVITPGATVHN